MNEMEGDSINLDNDVITRLMEEKYRQGGR